MSMSMHNKNAKGLVQFYICHGFHQAYLMVIICFTRAKPKFVCHAFGMICKYVYLFILIILLLFVLTSMYFHISIFFLSLYKHLKAHITFLEINDG